MKKSELVSLIQEAYQEVLREDKKPPKSKFKNRSNKKVEKVEELKSNATKEDCEKWLKWLGNSPYVFHLDDDVNDVIWETVTPTKADLKMLDNGVNKCFDILGNDRMWEVYWDIVKLKLDYLEK